MDTNLTATLLKMLLDQKAVAPVANGQSLLIWSMVLSALGPVLAAAAAYFAKMAQSSAEKSRTNTEESKKEIVTLKEHINSRMDELQEQTKRASFAEGQTQERASAAALVPPLPVVLTTPAETSELMKMIKTMSEEIAAMKAKA